MPKPIFDIQEYELRGVTPPVFSEAQKKRLNQVLSRANGQMDWTAQLLGFNGPNYWGLPSPKADGSYNWKGLPDTMNQKRQLQSTAFGVYNKDRAYDNRPAPFNRSEILASGDASFHIWESNGKTQLSPAGQGEGVTYGSPNIFPGGEYIFDAEVTFTVVGTEKDVLTYSYFSGEDKQFTRVLFKQTSGLIQVVIKGSKAEPAFLDPLPWKDISDWKSQTVLNQFIGLWGNKGNSFSFDASFDALELHGYDEAVSLKLDDALSCLTPTELLAKVGLISTEWTQYYNTKFGFQADGCPIAYPLPADQVADGFVFYTCEGCNSTITMSQNRTLDATPGIKDVCFEYKPTQECGFVEYPCLEFAFDPTLNDGSYPRENLSPTNPGPWMTADDGTFDSETPCYEGAVQSNARCADGEFCGFDDGVYNKLVFPNCEDLVSVACAEINGGFDNITGPPNYEEDCDCYVDCCLADGAIYRYGDPAYLGPNIADDGIYGNPSTTGIFYSNDLYDRDPLNFSCLLNDGTLEDPPSTSTVSEGKYDRVLTGLVPCVANGPAPEPIPCPISPVRVNLKEIFEDIAYKMEPDLANCYTPLRVWKNRVLTVTDEVPAAETEQYNFLTADENRGTEPEGGYRSFIRLPIEYSRNGEHWNKAEAVCNNQSYFSAPPNLAQTQNDPPVLRPVLYDEYYWDTNLKQYDTFYEEGYLVSTVRGAPQEEVQEGFSDSSVSYETPQNIPFAYAAVTDYDAFDERIPQASGEWRGRYLTKGVNQSNLTGFVVVDLESQSLELVPTAENPTYDMSRIKRPNVEFPDGVDQAALKNYVVSYAYFVTDYSASDDPVFDPDNMICWRQETLTNEKLDSVDVCVSSPLDSHTAYLLHPTA
jgi:hypothetical protein